MTMCSSLIRMSTDAIAALSPTREIWPSLVGPGHCVQGAFTNNRPGGKRRHIRGIAHEHLALGISTLHADAERLAKASVGTHTRTYSQSKRTPLAPDATVGSRTTSRTTGARPGPKRYFGGLGLIDLIWYGSRNGGPIPRPKPVGHCGGLAGKPLQERQA